MNLQRDNYWEECAQREALKLGTRVATDVHLLLALLHKAQRVAAVLESVLVTYAEMHFYVSLDTEPVEITSLKVVKIGSSVQLVMDRASELALIQRNREISGLHILRTMLDYPGVPLHYLKVLEVDLQALSTRLDIALKLLPHEPLTEPKPVVSPPNDTSIPLPLPEVPKGASDSIASVTPPVIPAFSPESSDPGKSSWELQELLNKFDEDGRMIISLAQARAQATNRRVSTLTLLNAAKEASKSIIGELLKFVGTEELHTVATLFDPPDAFPDAERFSPHAVQALELAELQKVVAGDLTVNSVHIVLGIEEHLRNLAGEFTAYSLTEQAQRRLREKRARVEILQLYGRRDLVDMRVGDAPLQDDLDQVSQQAPSNVAENFESERALLPSESDRKALPLSHRIMDALRNAHEDAMRRNHGEVHEVHVALGLIFEALKTEKEFVKARQKYIADVLHHLESIAHVRYTNVPGMNTATVAQWPGFGCDVVTVLENAFVEMKRLHSEVIDLNHVALAIIRKGDREVRSCVSDWHEMKGLASRLEQCVAWSNSRTRNSTPLAEQINIDCLNNYFLPVNAEQTFFSFSKNPITNLSTNSKYSLWYAWERAGKHAQNDVNIDHLLGGILSSQLDSQTCDFLREFGLTRTDFEEHCNFAIKRGVRRTVPDLRLHPLAKRVLLRANMIAEKLGKSLTEPEHILLSILSEDRGMALPFFEYLNIDAKSAYQSLRARLESV